MAKCTAAARQLARLVNTCRDPALTYPKHPHAGAPLTTAAPAPIADYPTADPCGAIACSADCTGQLAYTGDANRTATCGWHKKSGECRDGEKTNAQERRERLGVCRTLPLEGLVCTKVARGLYFQPTKPSDGPEYARVLGTALHQFSRGSIAPNKEHQSGLIEYDAEGGHFFSRDGAGCRRFVTSL